MEQVKDTIWDRLYRAKQALKESEDRDCFVIYDVELFLNLEYERLGCPNPELSFQEWGEKHLRDIGSFTITNQKIIDELNRKRIKYT